MKKHENMPNGRPVLVLGPLKGEKRAKHMSKRGQKYKIVNFEAEDAFEVL